VRQVPSAENLTAEVEGDIEDVGGVLKITTIRLHYRIQAPVGKWESIERLLGSYAEACPAYQSVKGCIDCSWSAEIEEA
jgi:uncharacterized OsmC-like protein